MKSLIILSGGMDSAVLLSQFVKKYGAESIQTLTFDYGSKHNKREGKKAKILSDFYGVKNTKIKIDFIKDFFKSDLLKTGGDIPEGHYEDKCMRSTVVPFRNGIMLSLAIGFAESIDFDAVALGNHFGDHAIYPDCRESFVNAFKVAAYTGTYKKIKLISPFVKKTKRQIALIGKKLNVPFEETFSCYKGGKIHCGVCGTCVERKEALRGFDPTKYERE